LIRETFGEINTDRPLADAATKTCQSEFRTRAKKLQFSVHNLCFCGLALFALFPSPKQTQQRPSLCVLDSLRHSRGGERAIKGKKASFSL
jgi:hypothetical protein